MSPPTTMEPPAPAPLRRPLTRGGLVRGVFLPPSPRRLLAAIGGGLAALGAATAGLSVTTFGVTPLAPPAFCFLLVLVAATVAGRLAAALALTPVGAALLAYEFVPPHHSWALDDPTVITAVAMFVITAAIVALLVAAQATAREAAAAARDRLAFLAAAGDVLASSLDYEATLGRLAELAVPALADWCSIDIVEQGRIRQLRLAHPDPRQLELVRELRRRVPPDPGAASGVAAVVRSGRTEFHPEIAPELIEAIEDADLRSAVARLDLRSAITAPLNARGHTLGAITLALAGPGRRYAPADRTLAEDLARRAALAIDNSRLYSEQRHVARTLQESLLPRGLPSIPGVAVAVRYQAAGAANDVGGDFYDVWVIDEASFGLLIGDVCGKGPEAAALTGLTRHTVHTASVVSPDRSPRLVLEVTNDAVLRRLGGERFCTLVYGHARRHDDGYELVLASAGHPLPALLRDGEVVELRGTGTLLGVVPDIAIVEHRVELRPGDRLVLWTDGVTERRRGRELFGEERLLSLLRSLAGEPAEAIAAAVLEAVARFGESEPSDDIALVVLELGGAAAGEGGDGAAERSGADGSS